MLISSFVETVLTRDGLLSQNVIAGCPWLVFPFFASCERESAVKHGNNACARLISQNFLELEESATHENISYVNSQQNRYMFRCSSSLLLLRVWTDPSRKQRILCFARVSASLPPRETLRMAHFPVSRAKDCDELHPLLPQQSVSCLS